MYSQQGQDGVLAEIFRRLGVTNRFYVEFGFDADDFGGGSGPNTRNLWEQGWRGLLLDGSHANASINLHRHYIQPDNIAALFKKYEVPKEADYVSIDLDSCDIWVLLELAKEYRPRVVSVEYNSNFPAGRCAPYDHFSNKKKVCAAASHHRTPGFLLAAPSPCRQTAPRAGTATA